MTQHKLPERQVILANKEIKHLNTEIDKKYFPILSKKKKRNSSDTFYTALINIYSILLATGKNLKNWMNNSCLSYFMKCV